MDLSNVISVGILPEGKTVAPDNMNAVCIMSSEAPLSSSDRYKVYKSVSAVESDFGTYSSTYAFASILFQQTPNPVNVGGALIVGYYRNVEETLPATSGVLIGSQINEAQVISELQKITDGSMVITIDGTDVSIDSLNFSTTTTISGVLNLITGIVGATCTFSDQRFVVTSDSTGATSTMSVAKPDEAGVFIGNILGLSDGGVVTDGVAETINNPETKLQAVTAVKSLVNFKGFCFIDNTTDSESENLANWSQANAVLGYDVFSDISNLEVDNTNPVWKITSKGQSNYVMFYGTDRRLAAGAMARQHSVNLSGENTTNTLNLKEIRGIEPVDYSQTTWQKAKTVGLSIYTLFKHVPKLITSGANGWADDSYNLIALVDAIQVDAFNLLGTTPTKVPQTNKGVNQLVDQCEQTTRRFVRAGAFAPGTWSSSDYFGNKEAFDRNILENGYYWLAGSLADQSQDDRQARKSPVIQGAVKNAGAIHSANILINFNL
jgi:hypothetical protein